MFEDNSHFLRLPESVQQSVVRGLDAEIEAGFKRIEHAKVDPTKTDEDVRAIENDIVKAAELRNTFLGKNEGL